MGKKGLGGTFVFRRDRLPSDIPGEYMHKKTYYSNQNNWSGCLGKLLQL